MIIAGVAGFGALVRDQRKQQGVSQARMAEDLGVSRRWLIQFENGDVPNPGFATILAMMRYLGLALDVRQVMDPSRAPIALSANSIPVRQEW